MGTAREELVRELEALRVKMGTPSLRSIAVATGCSHTTVAKLLSPDQALPSWARVSTIAVFLEGNVDHVRHLWVAARREAGNTQGVPVTAGTATDDSRQLVIYHSQLYVLIVCALVVVTIGGALSREAGWLLSVGVQLAAYFGAVVVAVGLRSRYRPDSRGPMMWFATSSGCTVVAEALQILAPHITTTAPLTLLSDVLYLSSRVLLIACLTVYLHNRSTVAIGPWVRLGIGWTPVIWLCGILTCFLLMSGHIENFGRPEIVQLVVNAFYLTFDIQFAVLASVVLFKYAPKRGPFFLMLLVGTSLLISDTAWNLLGPTTAPTPFTVGVAYVVAGTLMLVIALNPDLRSARAD